MHYSPDKKDHGLKWTPFKSCVVPRPIGWSNGMGTIDLIIGKVVMIHIKDDFISPEGKIDILKIRPLARLGYYDYTSVESIYEIKPPQGDPNVITGLKGRRQM